MDDMKILEKEMRDFLRKGLPDPDDPTKLLFANDEYYNHREIFTDSKGKKWTDVTTDYCPR